MKVYCTWFEAILAENSTLLIYGGHYQNHFLLSAHNHTAMNTTLSDRAAHCLSGFNSNKNMMIRVDMQMLSECECAGLFERKGHLTKRNKPIPGLSHWIYLQMARALKEHNKESM